MTDPNEVVATVLVEDRRNNESTLTLVREGSSESVEALYVAALERIAALEAALSTAATAEHPLHLTVNGLEYYFHSKEQVRMIQAYLDWLAMAHTAEIAALKGEVSKLRTTNERLNKELDEGDSWAWIRRKFEAFGIKFRWYTPRTDSLRGTRYEVMGWLHCLFSDADPTVFIDITLEHQKRTDEAEKENAALKASIDALLIDSKRDAELVAEAHGELLKLKAEVARLSAPVMPEECRAALDAQCPLPEMASLVNRIIAARTTPAKEQP